MEPSRTTTCSAAIVFDENLPPLPTELPLPPEPGSSIAILMSHRYRLFLQPFDEPAIELEDVTTPDLCYSAKFPPSLLAQPTLFSDFVMEIFKSLHFDAAACEELTAMIESLVNEAGFIEEEFLILARADVDETDVIDHEKALAWLPSFSTDLVVQN